MRGVFHALSFAEQERQVILDLLIPPAPVVIDVVAPEIHPCVNPLRIEHALDARGALLEHVLPRALTDAEDDFPLVVHADIRVTRRHAGEVVIRRIAVLLNSSM